VNSLPFAAEVAAYLDACAAHRSVLDPKYHPTEDGAVKSVPHRGYRDKAADKAAEEQIRAAYRAAVTSPRRESGTSGTSGTSAGQTPRTGFRPAVEVPEPPEPLPPSTTARHPATTGGTIVLDDPRAVLAAAALDAAARGWHVFPVRPGDKRPAYPDHTEDRCNGTDPRCRNGHQGWEPRATTDPGRIRRAWSSAAYNVGIATGPSGLVVIDLDVPKPGEEPPGRWAVPGVTDGADALAVLCEEHGEPMPFETFMVRTRRGGMHLYFEAPAGTVLRNTRGETGGGLGWMIDTRAHGGFVVGAGSFVDLPDGTGRYEVIYDRPPAPLPAWLASLLNPAHRRPVPVGCVPAPAGTVTDLPSYAETALRAEVERVVTSPDHGHNWALNKAAFNLGRRVAAGILPRDIVERELQAAGEAAHTNETPARIAAVIRAGIEAGMGKAGRAAA
jgi:hypothetical protein